MMERVKNHTNIHFIAFGDISFSSGSRTLFREMLKAFEREGFNVHCRLFQMRIEGLPETKDGKLSIKGFPYPVFSPTSKGVFRILPRPLFRLYERVVIGLHLWRCLSALQKDDRLILHGCLGVLHVLPFRIKSQHRWWYKVGVIEEEVTHGITYRIRKYVERLNANCLGKRMVVSRPMGTFIRESYGAHKEQDFILPCLVNKENFQFDMKLREKKRLQMGVEDKLVVLYLGSAEPQQSPSETIRYFITLKERVEHAFLWVLSADKAVFRELLMASSLEEGSWCVDSKPYQELGQWLPAADVALLMRPRGLINKVSSPVKFPEYLMNGLAVIIGPEVGEYTAIVREHQLGVVVEPHDESEWAQSLQELLSLLEDRKPLRQRCFDVADGLSWQGYAERLRDEFCKADVES